MICSIIAVIYVTSVSHNVPSFYTPHDQFPVNFDRPEVNFVYPEVHLFSKNEINMYYTIQYEIYNKWIINQ